MCDDVMICTQAPLDPNVSGVYRCEAWPHGVGGPPYGQDVAQDLFLVGQFVTKLIVINF